MVKVAGWCGCRFAMAGVRGAECGGYEGRCYNHHGDGEHGQYCRFHVILAETLLADAYESTILNRELINKAAESLFRRYPLEFQILRRAA